MRKNIQYLTEDEVSKVKVVLTEGDSFLCLREKAIGLLALYTGLRSSCISRLAISDIDWEHELIRIRQQKTGVPLELPLHETIGNAIYDYLITERPNCADVEVFISQARPFTRLTRASMYDISKRIMSVAKIRLNLGDRKGFHLFRHHMAISLLENDVSQPVISQTMGHSSLASLNIYLNADFSHLKEYALTIECFPLKKGVLSC